MNAEFLSKLKTHCDKYNIDIDILDENELLLIYNGTTFDLQYDETDSGIEIPLSITEINVKGKVYNYQYYSFVDEDYTDCYDTIDDAIDGVINAVVSSDVRKRTLRLLNSWESFIEDISEQDLNILVTYIKNKYD